MKYHRRADRRDLVLIFAMMIFVGPVGSAPVVSRAGPVSYGAVSAHRLATADAEPGQWFTSGRDAGGTYFSPLTQIARGTVGRLGFAWHYSLGTTRGLEATPVVVDGVMYASGNFGRVYALDAATGREIWTFLPDLEYQWIRYACCDVVNRGISVWQGRVYVGTIDGYLYALDAKTGATVWKTDTLLGRAKHVPYTITGAPIVTRDAVVIGNAGAEFSGVRGYITAYDMQNGSQKWRFFTVPRNPALGPQDQPHLVKAIKTWDPRHQWDAGGGGSVWDGLAYDSKTDLVFLGTANVSPSNTREDGRKGGDELYAASVIAVHADSGTLAWYYQEVPDDRWDFDCTEKFVLATMTIGDKSREVLLHAPKNGFFYVFDRITGELLSAKNYTYVNWTKGLDPATGRPIPNPAADYHDHPRLIWPSEFGAHSWQPMSFDVATGLVYIPSIENPTVLLELSHRPAKSLDGGFTTTGMAPGNYDPAAVRSLYGKLPTLKSLEELSPGPMKTQGVLKAWDPIAGRIVWQIPGATIWDGGVMSTAGGLVFRGDAHGFLNVYAAETGRLLRSIDVETSIMAAPMTYTVRGEQYVAFMAGFGGVGGIEYAPDTAAYKYGNAGRIVALKLGGGPVPKPPVLEDAAFEKPPEARGSARQVAEGEILYNRFCSRCHVFGRGLMPDLRRMSAPTNKMFYEIVLHGAYQPKGMGRWDDVLSHADAERIYAYITDQAWSAFESSKAKTSNPVNSH